MPGPSMERLAILLKEDPSLCVHNVSVYVCGVHVWVP